MPVEEKPRDYDALMRLPAGRTCGDCSNFRRCLAFGYTSVNRTQCDFWPSRYHEVPEKERR